MSRAVIALVVGSIALAGRPAHADSDAEAVVLFDQGIKDMKAGRLDKACAELQSSLDLVKDSGTKGALARCHGLAGRIASAWLLWRELADTAPSAALRNDAANQAQKLEPRLPRYTVTLARPMADVVIEINGRRVASNVPVSVPIDPGKLSVRAVRQDGDREGEAWRHEYTAVERQTVTIEIPALPAVEPVVRKDPATRKPRAPVVPPPTDDARHGRHVIAGVLGVVALGGAGVGAYFGLHARSLNDEARALCGQIQDCPVDKIDAAKAKVDDARKAANVSTIAFAAAGAVALTATIVWLTAPSAPAAETRRVVIAPAVGPDQLGLIVRAVF